MINHFPPDMTAPSFAWPPGVISTQDELGTAMRGPHAKLTDES